MAPEILKKHYNEKCDIWSCGILLFILLAGAPPFFGKVSEDIYKKIEKQKYDIKVDYLDISKEAKNLIQKLLEPNFELRISAKEALEDPWIQTEKNDTPLDPKILENLSNFHEKNKFRYTIFTFIASQVVSNEEKKELYKTFCQLDNEQKGKLSENDLIQGYLKIHGDLQLAKKSVSEIMKYAHFNNNNEINFTEFLVAALEKEKMTNKEIISKAFKIFDIDGNGFISKNDLQNVLFDIGENNWNYILKKCDVNNDGKISLEELTNFLIDQQNFDVL